MKELLNQIVKDLLDIKNNNHLVIEDKDIMDFAVRILNSGSVKEKKEASKYPTKSKPTEKQINFLKANDYNGDMDELTFEEAKVIISEFIKRQKRSEV
jgi:hypothetical protein